MDYMKEINRKTTRGVKCLNCGKRILFPINRLQNGHCLCDECFAGLYIAIDKFDYKFCDRNKIVARLQQIEDKTLIPFKAWDTEIENLTSQEADMLGFVSNTKEYVKYGCICFNDSNSTFARERGKKIKVIYKNDIHNYSDILGFELLKDGHCEMRGGVGKALVGGVLLGTVGAIAGASSRRTDNKADALLLKVVTNKDTIIFPFIKSSINKNTRIWRKAMIEAEKAAGKLQQIINTSTEKNDTVSGVSSIASEIQNLRDLLDNNSITKEEFELLKSRLINEKS